MNGVVRVERQPVSHVNKRLYRSASGARLNRRRAWVRGTGARGVPGTPTRPLSAHDARARCDVAARPPRVEPAASARPGSCPTSTSRAPTCRSFAQPMPTAKPSRARPWRREFDTGGMMRERRPCGVPNGAHRTAPAPAPSHRLLRRSWSQICRREGLSVLTDHVRLNEPDAAAVADLIGCFPDAPGG
jgi:hypothetical protein